MDDETHIPADRQLQAIRDRVDLINKRLAYLEYFCAGGLTLIFLKVYGWM
jgi:hypothetical protein